MEPKEMTTQLANSKNYGSRRLSKEGAAMQTKRNVIKRSRLSCLDPICLVPANLHSFHPSQAM